MPQGRSSWHRGHRECRGSALGNPNQINVNVKPALQEILACGRTQDPTPHLHYTFSGSFDAQHKHTGALLESLLVRFLAQPRAQGRVCYRLHMTNCRAIDGKLHSAGHNVPKHASRNERAAYALHKGYAWRPSDAITGCSYQCWTTLSLEPKQRQVAINA